MRYLTLFITLSSFLQHLFKPLQPQYITCEGRIIPIPLNRSDMHIDVLSQIEYILTLA